MNRLRIKLFSIIILIFFQPDFLHSAIYYVKNNGNDDASGFSDAEAWKSISKINSFIFKSGDTVRFKRGDLFDDATLKSPRIDNFTIEDYGSGPKPKIDGDKIQPIYIDDPIKNLTIRNIDISGQDWTSAHGTNAFLINLNGLILDGIEVNGHGGSNGVNYNKFGCNPIRIILCSGEIEIKNCSLYNWGPNEMPAHDTGEIYAFFIDRTSKGTFKVHHNIVHDINADAIQIRMYTGFKGEIYNNRFYNCGENAVDIKASDNIDVYHNEFYREPGFVGHGGIGGNRGHLINVIGSTEAGGSDSDNNTIRENYLHDCDDAAIRIGFLAEDYYNDNIKIYLNWIENTRGIAFGNSAVNLKIYDNIIVNSKINAIKEENGNLGTEIYNNIIYNDHDHNLQYTIYLKVSNQTVIKNNVVFIYDPDAYGLYLQYGSFYEISCNYWYNASSESRINLKGELYSTSNLSNWQKLTNTNETFIAPQFNNPEILDLSLKEAAYCNGEIVGVRNYSHVQQIKNNNKIQSLTPPSRLRFSQKTVKIP